MNQLFDFMREQIADLGYVVSFNVIGSAAAEKQISMSDEVDLYVLLNQVTQENVIELTYRLKQARLVTGSDPVIEYRRGPFRSHGNFQFHLIIDDLNSIQDTSPITLADWARTALLLKGTRIDPFIRKQHLRDSFKSEVCKTLQMLRTMRITYKRWCFHDDSALLRDEIAPVMSAHEYFELLKYAYKAMRADYVALTNGHDQAALCDSRLLSMIENFKRGMLHRVPCDHFLERVLSWNCELLRITQKEKNLLTNT